MKANPKNALMIVAALLVFLAVYVLAFYMTMKLKVTVSDLNVYTPIGMPVGTPLARADLRPRWEYPSDRKFTWGTKAALVLFAPLIWVEHQVRPPEYWVWKDWTPKPEWMNPDLWKRPP